MEISSFGKLVIAAGIVLTTVGVLMVLAPKAPLIGRLPGDFLVRKDDFTFYFPLVTMLLLSLVLTIVLNIVFRIFRG